MDEIVTSGPSVAIPRSALDELEGFARELDSSFAFGWIVGWLDKWAPDDRG